MKTTNIVTIFIGLTLLFYLLIIGDFFFIPLIIAIVVWYLIIILAGWYKKIKIKNYKIPNWLSIIISLITIFAILWIIATLLTSNIQKVVEAAPSYQEKIQILFSDILTKLNIDKSPSINETLESINTVSLVGGITNFIKTITGNISMILIYVLLLLAEYSTFNRKLSLIITKEDNRKKTLSILKKIDQDIKTYISIKSGMSLLTATLSYIVLLVIGVDFPVFWAMLIFLLNYIPTIGSIIAVIFPILLTLVQFDSLQPFILVTILLISIQVSIGNILEPKLMGNSLNLSPLVIVISLVLWGKIWGVTGMFLCIPIMVILNIILSKFDSTRPIAIVLSGNGMVK